MSVRKNSLRFETKLDNFYFAKSKQMFAVKLLGN